ncbi:MAG TPA: 30S ribosomal protein S17e [Candidatus Woesearchaeota archaeon]|nr:30S ribosomal protein S17e [Candidatus Woesearchaeota archaeon]
MGRIKTSKVKRITLELVKSNPDVFIDNFDENKRLVEGFLDSGAKKIRNPVAGYVTRIIKKKKLFA